MRTYEENMKQRTTREWWVSHRVIRTTVAGIAVLAVSACASYRIVPAGSSTYEVSLPPKSCASCGPDPKAMELATNFCAQQRADFGLIPVDMINSSEPAPFMFRCDSRL
jgi:hypothetical protein